jgi:hypothetical protein
VCTTLSLGGNEIGGIWIPVSVSGCTLSVLALVHLDKVYKRLNAIEAKLAELSDDTMEAPPKDEE